MKCLAPALCALVLAVACGREGVDASPAEPTGDAAVGGDASAACGDPPALEACFRGAAFADCGGDAAPLRACEDGTGWQRCLWFPGGCPAAGWTPTDMPCRGGQCLDPNVGWGDRPWDRHRDMALDVAVDPALAPDAPSVECACDAPTARGCAPGFVACDPRWDVRIDVTVVEPSSPGLLVVTIGVPWEGGAISRDDGELYNFEEQSIATLELDFFTGGAPRGRLCLVHHSDASVGWGPLCADAGQVVVNRRAGEPGDLRARVDARFPAFERVGDIRNLRIRAAL